MSGFEIVGVVLGTLPLVLGAVSQYGKGVSTPDPGPLFFLGSEDGCSRTNAKTQEVLWSCSNGTRPQKSRTCSIMSLSLKISTPGSNQCGGL